MRLGLHFIGDTVLRSLLVKLDKFNTILRPFKINILLH